jgi:tRNA(Ile)-lysidine synthase
MPERIAPVSATEAKSLFGNLTNCTGLLLAVSGGPDSMALMMLAVRWRDGARSRRTLFAATVDHGLRQESRAEALAVARLARRLSIPHRILRWSGPKPKTGLPQAARAARYSLLVAAAKKAGASHILTAHTLDDQAETVIMRMARGSGIGGLSAMARESTLDGLVLVRPLLEIPKARLLATLAKEKIPFADDPTNRDTQFTRARLRTLMPELAREGLHAGRLALLANRMRRADQALDAATDRALAEISTAATTSAVACFDGGRFFALPREIGLRVLRRLIDRYGDEGRSELGKLEAMFAAAVAAAQNRPKKRFRRSLAGAVVTISGGMVTVERAPPRRRRALTTARAERAKRSKAR